MRVAKADTFGTAYNARARSAQRIAFGAILPQAVQAKTNRARRFLLLLLATRPLTRHSTAVEQTCALPCTALPRSAARATQIGSFAAHGEPDTLALRAACAQRLLRPLRARLCAHTRAPQRLPGTTTDLVS